MERLKPYDGEFSTVNDLNDIVNRLAERLNHEKSQSNNQKPIELWTKEKEHFRSLNHDLVRYFNSDQTRKVSQDSMIRFQNHQYSVSLIISEKKSKLNRQLMVRLSSFSIMVLRFKSMI